MKFFLAGTMRGSEKGNSFVSQNYRVELKNLLKMWFVDPEIYDPLGECDAQDSNDCSFEIGRETYFREAIEVKGCDVLIAFLPEASMGTAIEMWEAYRNSVYIISITEMIENWTIKYLSDAIFPSMPHFKTFLKKNSLSALVKEFEQDVSVRYGWNRF